MRQLLNISSTHIGIQNPSQNITLRRPGTGAALRGRPVYWVLQKFLTTVSIFALLSISLFLSFLARLFAIPPRPSLSCTTEDFFKISTREEINLSPSWLRVRWFRHETPVSFDLFANILFAHHKCFTKCCRWCPFKFCLLYFIAIFIPIFM